MTEQQFKEFVKFFVEKHNISDVDCFSEVERISEKSSKLSKKERDAVSAITAFSISSGMKNYMLLFQIARKFDSEFSDICDIKIGKSDSQESAILFFISKNKKYKFNDKNYCQICKFDCFALYYAILKHFDLFCSFDNQIKMESRIEHLTKENFETVTKIAKALVDCAVKVVDRSDDRHFKRLYKLKLLF